MPAQFYELTPREFNAALKISNDYDETLQRFELEKMRLQTLYLINVHLDKKDKITDVRKLMPFAWDQVQVHIPTQDDWEKFDKIAQKIWQQKPLMS